MKTRRLIFAVALALAISACAGGPETMPKLHVGETKAEVPAALQEPMTKATAWDGTESWVYAFGLAKKFIPFYGPFTDTTAMVVTFGPDGRLTRWGSATTHL